METSSPPQSLAALSTRASRTAWRSNTERLIDLRTSEVAVCCCSDSCSSRLLARSASKRRVFDGDNRLVGKALKQLDLLFSERLHFLTIDPNHANELIVLEDRYAQQGAGSGSVPELDDSRIAVEISLRGSDVRNFLHLFCSGDAREYTSGSRTHHGVTPPRFGKLSWCTGERHVPERSIFINEEVAELGLAKAHGIRQQRLEHGLKSSVR